VRAETANIRTIWSTAKRRRVRLLWRISYVSRRVWNGVSNDYLTDMAAEVSFYFVLSLFPFFLVLAAIVGWLPSTDLWQSFAQWVIAYFPRFSRSLVFKIILDLAHGYKGFLSFGLATTLWTASSGFMSLMDALTLVYGGRRDARSYWRRRLTAILTTIGADLFFIVSFALWSTGEWAIKNAPANFQTVVTFEERWKVAWWLLTLVFLCIGLDLLNYFLPGVKRCWRWLTPGTVLVVVSFGLASLGLNLYVHYSPTLPRIYGTLAGFVVLMMWIYISTLILLIGAETDKVVDELQTERVAA
jgi:membrane protein